jgi:hypothetical protein
MNLSEYFGLCVRINPIGHPPKAVEQALPKHEAIALEPSGCFAKTVNHCHRSHHPE